MEAYYRCCNIVVLYLATRCFSPLPIQNVAQLTTQCHETYCVPSISPISAVVIREMTVHDRLESCGESVSARCRLCQRTSNYCSQS